MRKLFFVSLMVSVVSSACQNNTTQDSEAEDLASQAIALHDEIMPQIAHFDKHTVLIDSLLNDLSTLKDAQPDLDTVQVREQLNALKIDLENATDNMMTWMHEYEKDSTDVAYQEAEVQHMTALKAMFEKVTNDTDSILPKITNPNNAPE